MWSINTNFSPYMSIHSHQGKTRRLHLARAWASLCDSALSTQWHMSAMISVSHSSSIPTPIFCCSLFSFCFSTPIASWGLYKLAVSTESEMPALTWPPDGNASPDIDASIHKVLSVICKSAHFAERFLTPGIKKLFMHSSTFTGPLMMINDR